LKDKTVVPPGGKATVGLSWKAKGFNGPFQQTATVMTNDPHHSRLVLTVKGRISVAVRSVPPELVFTRITSGEAAKGSVQLFGYRPGPLEIKEFTWSDPSLAKYFEAELLPLPADQLKREEGATSGHVLEIRAKSGLPMGPFQQRITVATNQKEAPTVEIPIRGTVTSEISVVGPGWDEEDSLLTLGTLQSREGGKRVLLIVAGGMQGKEIQYKLAEVTPDLLKVELGTPKPMKGSSSTQTPLTITIPPGSPPANHLGSEQGKLGRITIETNHPHAPKLRILVRFAVEG
jgi:hypothetical protein